MGFTMGVVSVHGKIKHDTTVYSDAILNIDAVVAGWTTDPDPLNNFTKNKFDLLAQRGVLTVPAEGDATAYCTWDMGVLGTIKEILYAFVFEREVTTIAATYLTVQVYTEDAAWVALATTNNANAGVHHWAGSCFPARRISSIRLAFRNYNGGVGAARTNYLNGKSIVAMR